MAAVLICLWAINLRTIKVAFYRLDQRTVSGIKAQIDNMSMKGIRYYDLNPDADLPKNFQKKYSILISRNSIALKKGAASFVPVNEALFESMPTSIRKASAKDGAHYELPLLLDHFEISYYQISKKQMGMENPRNYGELLRYLESAKERVEFPLVCAGANDQDLFGFVSVMAESFYGADEYQKAQEALAQASSLNKRDLPESLTKVLDEIKAMQERNFIHPRWTRVSNGDLRYYMQERKIGALAMFLSERRDFEYNLIRYYDSDFFPRYDLSAPHGIVAPQIVAVLLKNKKDLSLILGQLSSQDVQTELSNASLLAPVASRAESYDRQADDVRFWAASSMAGPLGSLEDECETNAERRRLLAQKIRAYLEFK